MLTFCVLFNKSFLHPYPFHLVWFSYFYLPSSLLCFFIVYFLSQFIFVSLAVYFLPLLPWISPAHSQSLVLLSLPPDSCASALCPSFVDVTAPLTISHLQWNAFYYFHPLFDNTLSAICFSWSFSPFISGISKIN